MGITNFRKEKCEEKQFNRHFSKVRILHMRCWPGCIFKDVDLCIYLLSRCKVEIHSEIELTIYQLKWYSPTNIICLALLVLCPKLVLLLTEIFQYSPCLRNATSFIPPSYRKSRGKTFLPPNFFIMSVRHNIFVFWDLFPIGVRLHLLIQFCFIGEGLLISNMS